MPSDSHQRVQLDVGALDGERVEEGGVEPADPSAQIEAVYLECRAGVAGQESGDGVLDALADWVGLDQDGPTTSLEWVVVEFMTFSFVDGATTSTRPCD